MRERQPCHRRHHLQPPLHSMGADSIKPPKSITDVSKETVATINKWNPILLGVMLFMASLLLEFVACVGFAVVMAVYLGEYAHWLNRVKVNLAIWVVSLMYRGLFLHLYVSWRLKYSLIGTRLASPLVASADLALAFVYAGTLSLFLPSAKALFQYADWGVPIFSAIFLGSLAFSLLCRKGKSTRLLG